MEQKISIAKMRSAYCKQVEKDHRSLSEYLREINVDFKAYTEKQPASTARLKESYSFFAAAAMKAENLSLSFIKSFYNGIDSKGRICDFKGVALADEKEAREKFTDYDFIVDDKGICKMLVPVNLWTSSKVLAKIASAVKAQKDVASAAAQAVREQEKAERERRQYESAKARVLAYESKQAQAAQQAQAVQQESKPASKPAKAVKQASTKAAQASA